MPSSFRLVASRTTLSCALLCARVVGFELREKEFEKCWLLRKTREDTLEWKQGGRRPFAGSGREPRQLKQQSGQHDAY